MGSALWRSMGGPSAITEETELLRWVDHRLQVLVWAKTDDAKHGRNRPKPPKKLQTARERKQVDDSASAKAEAYRRRQEIRRRAAEK